MRICQRATCLVFAHRVKWRGQMASRDAVQRGGRNPLRTRSAVRTGNVVIFSQLSLSLRLFSFVLWNTSMRENAYMYNPFMRVCCVFGASPNRRRNIPSNELLSANREGQDTRAWAAFHETPLCICYSINEKNTVLYSIPAGK